MANSEKSKKTTAQIVLAMQDKYLANVQFELFPLSARAVPNPFLRSSAFSALGKGEREFVNEVAIAAPSGIEITYTGMVLDQVDLDYILTVWHLAQGRDCKNFQFQLKEAFGILDIADSGRARTIFDTRMKNLRASAFTIKSGGSVYVGGLVDEYFRDENGLAHVRINPRIIELFTGDQFTLLNWEVRKELRGKPLALWLHGFYSSHETPFAYKIPTLMQYSGSKAKLQKNFKVSLDSALNAVTSAHKKHDLPFEYRLMGDLVYVRRGKGAPLPPV